MSNHRRQQFRETVFSRDDETCLVPWCERDADDAHHIIERARWGDGGYVPDNGASLCNPHHQYAESNDIPPQPLWLWAGIEEPPLPDGVDDIHVDKWGDPFETPPWEDYRDRIKYQSSRHLLPLYWDDDETVAAERTERDDTRVESLAAFVDVPLVITQKIDGSNCMLVSDVDNPVRARNGSEPEETMRPLHRDGGLYWRQEVHQKLPDRLQVFGEWAWAKHSIHYGCDCAPPCDDVGPPLSELTGVTDDRAYFQVFGVYDTEFDLWFSWPRTEQVAETLGFPTVPVVADGVCFETEQAARCALVEAARDVIDDGGEGIVVRKRFPFHYGQFPTSLGKYVRENHVADDATHWRQRRQIRNKL